MRDLQVMKSQMGKSRKDFCFNYRYWAVCFVVHLGGTFKSQNALELFQKVEIYGIVWCGIILLTDVENQEHKPKESPVVCHKWNYYSSVSINCGDLDTYQCSCQIQQACG